MANVLTNSDSGPKKAIWKYNTPRFLLPCYLRVRQKLSNRGAEGEQKQ